MKNWSGREDLNLRPHAPHACALPGCATPRFEVVHHTERSIRLQGSENDDKINKLIID